ncbi:short-chain dehydrogenase/reductase family 9C member 7-like [Haliotis rufescens]|uniref:short-chain dehydrogenase/reductase family 9C member 7-like n=1 Tax=Haliotis rufescens TaxID=6454 RepID=UPI001EAFA44E|nr:short-chain dehydrogenase/reductase family 9C member 7-like [Haliotis rufescens]
MFCVACIVIAVVLLYTMRRKTLAQQVSPLGKYVLITGCDTGFGHQLAQRLDERGCNVIATCLLERGDGASELKRVSSERMHVLALDVTSDNSVRQCMEHVRGVVGEAGLWAVVNNAGVMPLGDVEFYTMDDFKQAAEVNMFGMVRVTKFFLPLIRKCQGRIVNVTSVKGLICTTHSAAYHMTKFAGEAFSDSLRLEMARFGIKVSIIEPGDYGGGTGMLGNMEIHRKNYDRMWLEASDDVRQVYGRQYLQDCYSKLVSAAKIGRKDLTQVINCMEDAVLAATPCYRYLIHGGNRTCDIYCVLARLKAFIPTPVHDYLVREYL